jgi:hypothetical protein
MVNKRRQKTNASTDHHLTSPRPLSLSSHQLLSLSYSPPRAGARTTRRKTREREGALALPRSGVARVRVSPAGRFPSAVSPALADPSVGALRRVRSSPAAAARANAARLTWPSVCVD